MSGTDKLYKIGRQDAYIDELRVRSQWIIRDSIRSQEFSVFTQYGDQAGSGHPYFGHTAAVFDRIGILHRSKHFPNTIVKTALALGADGKLLSRYKLKSESYLTCDIKELNDFEFKLRLALRHRDFSRNIFGLRSFTTQRDKTGYTKIINFTEDCGQDIIEWAGKDDPLNPFCQTLLSRLRLILKIAIQVYALKVNKLIHGDLKLDNICMNDQGDVQLVDLSCITETDKTTDIEPQYTVSYAAPELLASRRAAAISNKADVYSLGLTFIQLLHELGYSSNQKQCTGDMTEDTIAKIRQEYIDQTHLIRPTETIELLEKMLTVDPDTRSSIEEVIKCLVEMIQAEATKAGEAPGFEEHTIQMMAIYKELIDRDTQETRAQAIAVLNAMQEKNGYELTPEKVADFKAPLHSFKTVRFRTPSESSLPGLGRATPPSAASTAASFFGSPLMPLDESTETESKADPEATVNSYGNEYSDVPEHF